MTLPVTLPVTGRATCGGMALAPIFVACVIPSERMILTCPQCDTRYQADEAKFPSRGRNVRCAKCGHVWHQAPVASPADSEDASLLSEGAAASAPRQADSFRFHNPAPRVEEARGPWLGKIAVAAGWLALVAVIVLIGFSAVRYRQEIATVWPQSTAFYSALGLPVRGLDFRDLHSSRRMENGQAVLVVTGTIVDDSAIELAVPQTIRIILSDAKNHEVYRWTFAPDVTLLKPGQSTKFVTRLASPPATARHLEIHFVKDGG